MAGFGVVDNVAARIMAPTLAKMALQRDYRYRLRPCKAHKSREALEALSLDAFEFQLTLDRCLQNWLRWAMGGRRYASTRVVLALYFIILHTSIPYVLRVPKIKRLQLPTNIQANLAYPKTNSHLQTSIL